MELFVWMDGQVSAGRRGGRGRPGSNDGEFNAVLRAGTAALDEICQAISAALGCEEH